ncbi:Membrane associated serine protease, rhomboid family [Paramicrobacterium humi]|uniref:Membrane associated serine protease, rhomboid family n=1 Tax=Paramicrobacterium humi TaxID=640635 RepID=A0A1H4K6W6_9MICO|nr:rhomboid family intramembrane serine protease [Microbacterium humi]SEB54264.1 Membrane associated serine protease, rhomboid family [Microbacterium humi]
MSIPTGRDNYCYRHPDRQSFVLCQRCGRTICAECQTPAPVGVICPECMREQRASAPRVKPRSVSRVTSIMRADSGQPAVTYVIIALTLLVFVLQFVPGLDVTNRLLFAGVYGMPEFGHFEPWRMLTVALVHSTSFFLHVALNMYTLWIFGRMMEPMIGRWRFLTLYLVTTFGSSVGVMLLDNPLQPVVGASGAIFGLMGAVLVIVRHLGGNMTGLLVLVVINLVIGFIPGTNIAWQAHVGGLVTGALIGLIYATTRRRSQQSLQKLGVAGIVALLVVLAAVAGFIYH